MRVFLAVDVDSEVRKKIAALERELRPAIKSARWVREEGLHLTLRFFGEISQAKAESVAEALSRAFAGLPGFTMEIRGCGVFPDGRRPRVLWVSVEKPPEALFALQSRAEAVARTLGFDPEKRRFEPHLTVARFRGPVRNIDSILVACRERAFGVTSTAEATLYESHLSPSGASYRKLRSYRLEPVG